MQNKLLMTITLILMAPLAGMGIDIYAPALPLMQNLLHISTFLGGITMTTYLIGYAVGLAFMGPLSDSLGRMRVLYIGLCGYLLVTGALLFAQNIHVLILLRFLQGIMVAGPGVLFKVFISDCYDREEVPKMSSNVGIAWALGPVVAPFIGGFLAHHLGWQACFGFLIIYALFVLTLSAIALTESNPNFVPFHPHTVLKNYALVLSDKRFDLFITGLAISYGIFIVFNVSAPFLIQKTLHFTPVFYGSMALILGLSYFFGVVLNRVIIKKYLLENITNAGAIGMTLGSLMLLFTGMLQLATIGIIIAAFVIIYFFNGFILSNLLARCMLRFQNNAGTANAVMNAAFVFGSALLSILASHLPFASQLPLACVYTAMSVVLLIIVRVAN